MKKPKLIYPETFIAEREVGGKTEYAFAIKQKGRFGSRIVVKPVLYMGGMEFLPLLYAEPDHTSFQVKTYWEYPDAVQLAINKFRECVYSEYQNKIKDWQRKRVGEGWKYKPYP